MGSSTGNHREGPAALGSLTASRGLTGVQLVVALTLLGAAGVGATLLALTGLRAGISHGSAAIFSAAAPGVALLPLAVCGAWVCAHRVDFFECGVVSHRFGRRRTIRYDEVTSLTYECVRQSFKLRHVGTFLRLRLVTVDGRRLTLLTPYRDGRCPASLVRRPVRTDSATDAMDTVRDVVAAHIARRLSAQLDDAGAVDWCGAAVITPDGVLPTGGVLAGWCIEWEQIKRYELGPRFLEIFRCEDVHSFIRVPIKHHNFYPVFTLFRDRIGTDAPARIAA